MTHLTALLIALVAFAGSANAETKKPAPKKPAVQQKQPQPMAAKKAPGPKIIGNGSAVAKKPPTTHTAPK